MIISVRVIGQQAHQGEQGEGIGREMGGRKEGRKGKDERGR